MKMSWRFGLTWGLVISACLVLPVLWAVVAVPRTSFGKAGRADDTEVKVEIADLEPGLSSDGNFLNYFKSKDRTHDNFKVKALFDGPKLRFVTWDSPNRWFVVDFPEGTGCRPEFGQDETTTDLAPVSVHGYLNVDLVRDFTEVPEDGTLEFGTARLVFPDNNSDHWELYYSDVNVTYDGAKWTIWSTSGADLRNMNAGKPNNPAPTCAEDIWMPFYLTVWPQ